MRAARGEFEHDKAILSRSTRSRVRRAEAAAAVRASVHRREFEDSAVADLAALTSSGSDHTFKGDRFVEGLMDGTASLLACLGPVIDVGEAPAASKALTTNVGAGSSVRPAGQKFQTADHTRTLAGNARHALVLEPLSRVAQAVGPPNADPMGIWRQRRGVGDTDLPAPVGVL